MASNDIFVRLVGNKSEAKALAWFLEKERIRYMDDIRQIEADLEAIKETWGIDWHDFDQGELERTWVKVR